MNNLISNAFIYNFDSYAGITHVTGKPPLCPLAIMFDGSKFILCHKMDPNTNNFNYMIISEIPQEAATYMVNSFLADDLHDKMKIHFPNIFNANKLFNTSSLDKPSDSE